MKNKFLYTYSVVISMHEFRKGLLGLAVGDALGIPLVNKDRSELLSNPVTGMISGGEYDLPTGSWGLPTEITLAIKESLDKHGHLTKESIMNRLYDVSRGVYSIRKDVFTLGKITQRAVDRYRDGMDIDKCGIIDLNENGSGALLMMYPIAFYAYENKLQEKEIYELVKGVTELTHNHEINLIGCYIYTMYLVFLLRGKDKYASLSMLQCCDFSFFKTEYLQLYYRILKTSLKEVNIDNIRTDGFIVYIVEVSLYVLLNSNNYTQSVLGAINLGGKTNIVSSLVGCMAAILYGEDDIPDSWVQQLRGKDILDKFM